jgi:hypothetical protein
MFPIRLSPLTLILPLLFSTLVQAADNITNIKTPTVVDLSDSERDPTIIIWNVDLDPSRAISNTSVELMAGTSNADNIQVVDIIG